ncbi:hypothetical protein [Rhodoferax sp. WC2427]|uniref:hypothetical protein n=1 Tax=Rhodoferax sp. WC2427 TaxID=3234144 RepID=UPI003464EBA3
MAQDWTAPLDTVNFRCGGCRHAWEAQPDLIEDAPDDEHHPHRYFATCPRCQREHQPQAAWARNLMRAHQAATGPRTAEGLAKVGQNLAGHPNSEAQRRTRFNAMKHGMAAKTATYFPAKPDGYSFCAQCEVNRGWCEGQAACVKQTEIFMLHHAAFESRNPRVLAGVHADLQAGLTAMLQMLMQGVLADGVTLKVPKVELDREGNCVTLSYLDEFGERRNVYELSAHPALKSITDFVNRLGLSMNDLGMTARTADPEDEKGGGVLKLDAETQETLQGFGKRMELAMGTAREMLARAHKTTQEDPVLVAHEAREGKT